MGDTLGTGVTLDLPVPERLARWKRPLVYGFAASLATYAVVVLFLFAEIFALAQGGPGGIGSRSFLFGTLGDFYGSHVGVAGSVTLGIDGVGTVPDPLYVLVAPALLVWGGRFSAAGADPETDTAAAVAGARTVAGYLAAVIVGLAVLGVAAGFELLAVDPLRAVVVAGVVYPLVFGTVGGYTVRVW